MLTDIVGLTDEERTSIVVAGGAFQHAHASLR